MRISTLSLMAVLLLSSICLAQHTTTTPSSPPPSSPPAHVSTPSPSPSPAPSPMHTSAPSFPSSSQPTHSPAPTFPSPSNVEHHSPTVTAPRTDTPSSTSSAPPSNKTQQPVERDRVTADEKITGDHRIIGAPRIGENPPDKDKNVKAEPDLRHRVCLNGNCTDTPKPEPTQPDLRHRVCISGTCQCPSGQTMGKNGCVAAPVVSNQPACGPGTVQSGSACAPVAALPCSIGQVWNGTTCVARVTHCPVGETWDGAQCRVDCSSVGGRGDNLILELRSARQERDQACRQNSSGSACEEATSRYDLLETEYRGFLDSLAAECRSRFPDPISI